MTNPESRIPIPSAGNAKIAQVVVPVPVEGPFDYLIPDGLSRRADIGCRVFVPFGPRRLVGVIVDLRAKSPFHKLRPLMDVLDSPPAFDEGLLALAKEISVYYGCSLGEALEVMLPVALRRNKVCETRLENGVGEKKTESQSWLCRNLETPEGKSFFLEKILTTLAAGQDVIVLAPEVAETESWRLDLEENLKIPVTVLDRRMSSSEELARWQTIKEGRARVVIGTRSAVFAPVMNLGLMAVLEEDNPAYKQEQSPFYDARMVAGMRAKGCGASIIFASVAPTLETEYAFRKNPDRILTRAGGGGAKVQIVDMMNYKKNFFATLSVPIQNAIQQALAANGRVILFFNRRGFATVTRCNQCGYVARCERCEVNLVYEYRKKKLVCHLCSQEKEPLNICPQCNSSYVRSLGTGVEKLESETARLFPQARVAVFDRDTKALPKDANVIVATQAVVRILADIRPTVIGVLDFDGQISRSDFRSGQKMFSLLARFRNAATERVLVQTMDPDNYCLRALARDQEKVFYSKELSFRRELGFPPFRHLIEMVVRGKKKDDVYAYGQMLHQEMAADLPKGVEIFDLQPDCIPKLREKYRFTIMLKTRHAPRTVSWLKATLHRHKKSGVVVTVNVDA